MNDFYVYAWLRPCGSPFYIGKGRGSRDAQIKDHNPIFMRIVKKIERNGLKPRVERLRENLTEDEAFELERREIAKHGRINLKTGILANLTDGGEGASGTIVGALTRARLSEAGLRVWSDERHKQRLSVVQKRRFDNPAERQRNASITRETWANPEVRYKRAIGCRNARQSKKSRERTSEISRLSPPGSTNKSGFKGVFFSRAAQKWTAQIKLDGKSGHLGLFTTPEDAARAYDKAAFAAWGSDCYLNFPAELAV